MPLSLRYPPRATAHDAERERPASICLPRPATRAAHGEALGGLRALARGVASELVKGAAVVVLLGLRGDAEADLEAEHFPELHLSASTGADSAAVTAAASADEPLMTARTFPEVDCTE